MRLCCRFASVLVVRNGSGYVNLGAKTHYLESLFFIFTMSIQALNWALNQDSIENSGAKFVLLLLANYADENGQCWPSRETIAKKTAMSVRSVQNHINWLAENGYLKWTNEHTEINRQTPNIYQLPSAKSALGTQKPSANPAKAECKSRQKPSAESAQYTSEENHHKNTVDVFEFWKETMSLNGSTFLTPKRKKAIENRIKDGYNIERIKDAIRGCSISPFHCGLNDRKKKFQDIELICRSGEKVEDFESIWNDRPQEKVVSDDERKMREGLAKSQELFYGYEQSRSSQRGV